MINGHLKHLSYIDIIYLSISLGYSKKYKKLS